WVKKREKFAYIAAQFSLSKLRSLGKDLPPHYLSTLTSWYRIDDLFCLWSQFFCNFWKMSFYELGRAFAPVVDAPG
uniref:Uncharacterized protein n=1 Tax=Romanomermis culicivorax TaxID=13658 RepID=A0A915HNI2_ROMCU